MTKQESLEFAAEAGGVTPTQLKMLRDLKDEAGVGMDGRQERQPVRPPQTTQTPQEAKPTQKS